MFQVSGRLLLYIFKATLCAARKQFLPAVRASPLRPRRGPAAADAGGENVPKPGQIALCVGWPGSRNPGIPPKLFPFEFFDSFVQVGELALQLLDAAGLAVQLGNHELEQLAEVRPVRGHHVGKCRFKPIIRLRHTGSNDRDRASVTDRPADRSTIRLRRAGSPTLAHVWGRLSRRRTVAQAWSDNVSAIPHVIAGQCGAAAGLETRPIRA